MFILNILFSGKLKTLLYRFRYTLAENCKFSVTFLIDSHGNLSWEQICKHHLRGGGGGVLAFIAHSSAYTKKSCIMFRLSTWEQFLVNSRIKICWRMSDNMHYK